MLKAGIKLLRKDINPHQHHFESFFTAASSCATHCYIMEDDCVTIGKAARADFATVENRKGAAILQRQENMIALYVLLLGLYDLSINQCGAVVDSDFTLRVR